MSDERPVQIDGTEYVTLVECWRRVDEARADQTERIARAFEARSTHWRKAGAPGVADIFDAAAEIARGGGDD